MPADMSKYPKNWEAIRDTILRRAGGIGLDPRCAASCEFCEVENYTVRLNGEIESSQHDEYKAARKAADAHNESGKWGNAAVIVLTIAHLDDPDPMNCDAENLAALCQKCHNGYDADMRARNRKASAVHVQIKAGQMEMQI